MIGRWTVVDPLAELDRKTIPYAFDDPIRHTDPDGMFGEDVNEDFDQDRGPGNGVKVDTGVAIMRTPGLGGMLLEGIKDLGAGLLQGLESGIGSTAGALAATGGLVLMPIETGGGADKTTLPPELLAAHLLYTKANNSEKSSEPSATERGTAGKLEKSLTGKETVPASERAKQRVPSASEKAKEREANNNKCTNCGNETKPKDTRSHHYPKRHADGEPKLLLSVKTAIHFCTVLRNK